MEHRFEIFADSFQVYLQDNDIRFGDLSEAWTDEAVEKMLALGPHVIGVGTARNMTVPVIVRICGARPDSGDAGFERINECMIQIDIGRLVIAGCTDHFPDAARIAVAPGTYNALIGYKGLGTLSGTGWMARQLPRLPVAAVS
jgi:hypothetical protein